MGLGALLSAPVSLPVHAADDADDQEPVRTAVVERITVRLVELSVVALDRDEAPVAELEPGDLTLSVGGRTREVAYIRPFRPPPDDSAQRPAVRIGLETGGGTATSETAPRAPRYYLLFLDFGNEPLPRNSSSEEAIVGFLRDEIRDNDLVGVVSFTGVLNLDLPFTSDRDLQIDAVSRAFARSKPTGPNTRERIQTVMGTLEQCEYVFDVPWLVGEAAE